MSNEVTFNSRDSEQKDKKPRATVTRKPLSGAPAEGKITGIIGGGENAKNSFIWVTIRWSFAIASVITLGIYFRPVYCQADFQGDLIEDIKATWGIFMPVITLALGYAFGKGK